MRVFLPHLLRVEVFPRIAADHAWHRRQRAASAALYALAGAVGLGWGWALMGAHLGDHLGAPTWASLVAAALALAAGAQAGARARRRHHCFDAARYVTDALTRPQR